jgi:hypothetical protein
MFRRNRSIMLVDKLKNNSLVEALKKRGHSVLQPKSVRHALSILEYRAFEFVVINCSVPHVQMEKLLNVTTAMVPRPKTVLVDYEAWGADPPRFIREAAILRKPTKFSKLVETIEWSPARSVFSGQVTDVDILEYLQFLLLSGRKTVLEITSALGTIGALYVCDGKIMHASCGLLTGEAALYRLLSFREGTFKHLPWITECEYSIDKPGEYVLMEAARKRDENWSASSHAPKRGSESEGIL